jgi:uncharacterized protein
MPIKKSTCIFVVVTAVVSWGAIAMAWRNDWNDIAHAGVTPLVFVAGPALAALLGSFMFYRGQQLEVLGIRLRLNRWWLLALLIPLGLAAISIGVLALFSPSKMLSPVDTAQHLADLKHQQFSNPFYYLISSYLLGTAGYSALAIWEELGWRGYLYHLWRPFGFWRTSFATGFIWGIWHLPMNYWFGANFPEHRLAGLALFPIFTMLFAPLMTFVRDRGQSIWPVVILHGANNAASMFILFSTGEIQFFLVGYVSLTVGILLIVLIQQKYGLVADRTNNI